jgi:hypothetical protein
MSVALRTLDDGAWVSVNDERRVSVSELWRLCGDFCACEQTDLVVENVLDVGADGRDVDVRVYGQCIACGETGTTDWLPVGRIVDGDFRHYDRETVVAAASRRAGNSVR